MSTADTEQQRLKQRLRDRVRERRAALGDAESEAAGAALERRLRELVLGLGARRIACYLPRRGEPDTRAFLGWASSHGVEALLPVPGGDRTLRWAPHRAGRTAPGAFGIEEPIGPHRGSEALDDVELVLVPAAAVDRRGRRLGWGLGYYDRALAALGSQVPVFAVVHDWELLDELPSEAHDIPVSGVVTPSRTLVFDPSDRPGTPGAGRAPLTGPAEAPRDRAEAQQRTE